MEEQPEKKHDSYAPLRFVEFRWFIFARFLLTIATQMQGVIVGWQIMEKTGDYFAVGMIGLSEAIPYIVLSLFGGHVADIVSRKKIIVIAVTAFLLGAIALWYYTAMDLFVPYGVLPIYIIIFLTGIARGFCGPAIVAFWTQLVPREIYAGASAWNTSLWQAGAIGGPLFGGLIYGFTDAANAYTIDAVLIFLSIICFLFIGAKPITAKEKKESLKESLSSGIRFVFKNEIILGAMSLDLFAVLFGGAVALMPFFANEVLHVGKEGLGILRAAPAIGSMIMALYLAHHPPMKKAGKSLLFAVAGFGLCMIFFALSRNFYLSVFLLALSGALDNVSVVTRSTIMQLMTPDAMRGRVASVSGIFIGSSNEIGEFESGLAARLMGLIPSVIFGGCMTIGVVGFTAATAKKLRRLNLNEIK